MIMIFEIQYLFYKKYILVTRYYLHEVSTYIVIVPKNKLISTMEQQLRQVLLNTKTNECNQIIKYEVQFLGLNQTSKFTGQ